MSATRHSRIREIDFRRPTKFAREHIRRLEHAHEGFCRSASSRLSAELRTEFQLDPIGTDQLPYGTVMTEEVPRPALVTTLRMSPLETDIALVFELPLALSMVERLLGGAAASVPAEPAGLTEVEVAVARRALESLVDALSETWIDLAGVSLAIEATSTSPISVQIVPPSEPSLLMNFSAQIDGQLSIATLLLPHRSVESIMDRFEMSQFGPTLINESTTDDLHAAVGGVEVELRAEVGAVDMRLDDLVGLRPGAIVPLKRPAARGVVLAAGHVPAYEASPGRNGRSRAVQVGPRWEGA